MTYDCFMYNGEADLLEIRFNLLGGLVDKFVMVEGIETFSGNPKVLAWIERNRDRFEEWEDRVVYEIVSDYNDTEILAQIEARSEYVSGTPFIKAFYQKERLRKVLEKMSPDDEDIIIYGDSDEIINPVLLDRLQFDLDDKPHKLRQLAYSYYLNNRSEEDWRGTVITRYKNLRNGCLNDLRANPVEEDIINGGGWHFTNLGGLEAIKLKLESYDHQEANIPWVKDGLEERMKLNVDFLGRGYNMWIDESQLPQYILDNKGRYRHLWK